MMWNVVASRVAWPSIFFLAAAKATSCPTATVSLNVTTTADVQTLIDELDCTGFGDFSVSWYASLDITQTIDVFNNTSLAVTGVGFPTIRRAVGDDIAAWATATTGLANSLFSVSGGSTLSLKQLSLEGGTGDVGGAVAVTSSSFLSVLGCTFANNNASYGGGAIYAAGSQVYIDGSTVFANNSAEFGGALFASSSNVSIYGTNGFANNSASAFGGAVLSFSSVMFMDAIIDFSNNSAGSYGGAVMSHSSEISVKGTTKFYNSWAGDLAGAWLVVACNASIGGIIEFAKNTAATSGGALYVDNSRISMDGMFTFGNNSAGNAGGAFCIKNSNVSMDGSIGFLDNFSGYIAGAVQSDSSVVYMDAVIKFTNNSAIHGPGALLVFHSEIYIYGSTEFDNNWAGSLGGAVYAEHSKVYMDGSTDFSNNSAGAAGGAVYAGYSDICIDGSTYFAHNSAVGTGGAMYATFTVVSVHATAVFASNIADFGGAISGLNISLAVSNNEAFGNSRFGDEASKHGSTRSAAFIGNTAEAGGGAMYISGFNLVYVSNATFSSNKAGYGGAIYIAESVGKESFFSSCMFDGNEASDGGAVYLYTGTGVDTFTSSGFRANFAKFAGGAIFHTGSLHINNTSFHSNEAGVDGPAVMSIGVLEQLSDVKFSGNAFRCGAGEYGYIMINESVFCSVCFEQACTRCSTGGDGVINGDKIQVDGLPVCEAAPLGATFSPSGTTLETLVLDTGYYRTSNKSHVVVECYQREACVGGVDPGGICAVGYKGPYCAVCTQGFAPGVAYSCRECSASSKKLAAGLSAVVGIVVCLVAALISWRMGSVVNERTAEDVAVARSSRGPGRCFCPNLHMRMLPLSAIKIVVTVWQIIYQFAAIAGDVYPEVYADFVFKLTPINLDIGFMLSYSCLVTVDFFDRLLIATVMPPLVLLALVGSYYVGKKRNGNSEVAINVVKRRHLSAALFLAFWVYSSVSYTIFQTFACDDLDDGKAYLRADYSLQCSTTLHKTFKVYAWVMVALYPVGILAVFAWCLARNRDYLSKAERETWPHLESLNTLWAAYKPSRYWFELVECTRRVILSGIAAFVLPNSTAQISIILLVAVGFVFFSESMAPFKRTVDANLYRWGNGIIVASFYVALLLKIDLADESEESVVAFSGVLIAANIVMVVAVLVHAALLATQWGGVKTRVRSVDTPVRRTN